MGVTTKNPQDRPPGRPGVVIIGGGFAGLAAARELEDTPAHVTLIDRSTVHLFKPLLYQCATGMLSEGQISSPLRTLFARKSNVTPLCARVTGVNPDTTTLQIEVADGSRRQLTYDYLIVAAGVEQGYFGHPEYRDIAPGMRTLEDALTIRRKILQAFEIAAALPDRADRAPWLTFALVGAGPTGVELAGQIRELADHVLRRTFSRIAPDEAKVILFDGGDLPLASFGPELAGRAEATLKKVGVEFHPGAHVIGVDDSGVTVKDVESGAEKRVAARTVLWNAGITAGSFADELAAATGCRRERDGRLKVRPDLTLDGRPDIFVTGDLMSLENLGGVAEVAMQSGRHAARQIARRVSGRPAGQPFRYRNLGTAAYITRGQALVKAGPFRISGWPGWFVWGAIHLAFLTGYRNRVAAVLTWLGTLITGRRREMVYLHQR